MHGRSLFGLMINFIRSVMQFKNNLIDISLLGTSKKDLPLSDLPAPVQDCLNQMQFQDTDATEQFLKASSLSLAYYRAGVEPSKMDLAVDEALPEELAYCSDKAMALLSNLLDEKYYTLVWFWAVRCSESGKIVQPQALPQFFEWGVAEKKYYAPLFVSIIGNRGTWLSKFNTQWGFVKNEEEITDWETAGLLQRVVYLQKLRQSEPSLAIEKIKSVWKEENAAARTDLLATLMVNLGNNDESFIIEALSDKSKQVKEKALELLKLIPGSILINRYQDVLKGSIKLKESKMLGLISRTAVEVNLQLPDEEIFKTGIDKLSSDKKVSDGDYILTQLISQVPPSFWNAHFGLNIAETVKLFAQKDELLKFQPALCQSVIKFADGNWALEILKQFENSNVGLLSLVEPDIRQQYAERFVKQNLEAVMESFLSDPFTELNLKLAQAVISGTSQDPHRYHKPFYESLCIRIPQSIIPFLNTITFVEDWKRLFWNRHSSEIEKLINLKENIKTQTF
jgi:hypothetical protein